MKDKRRLRGVNGHELGVRLGDGEIRVVCTCGRPVSQRQGEKIIMMYDLLDLVMLHSRNLDDPKA